jgi:hypothetical protein
MFYDAGRKTTRLVDARLELVNMQFKHVIPVCQELRINVPCGCLSLT